MDRPALETANKGLTKIGNSPYKGLSGIIIISKTPKSFHEGRKEHGGKEGYRKKEG